jgi:hypothetical protein
MRDCAMRPRLPNSFAIVAGIDTKTSFVPADKFTADPEFDDARMTVRASVVDEDNVP